MSTKLKIEILNNQHIDQASMCLAHGFSREPMTKALDISFDELLHFTKKIIRKAASEGSSLVAVGLGGQGVIGVSVNKDLLAPPLDENDHFSDKFLPIFELLDQLDEEYHLRHQVNQNEIFHGLMIASNEKYKAENISFMLSERSFELAREKGFSKMIIEATGPISQHVAINKLGFKEYSSINYHSFEFGGVKVFKDINDVDSCKLLVKDLV